MQIQDEHAQVVAPGVEPLQGMMGSQRTTMLLAPLRQMVPANWDGLLRVSLYITASDRIHPAGRFTDAYVTFRLDVHIHLHPEFIPI